MNILVINDHSWDNFAIISKRLNSNCIDPDHKINYFYGKSMKYISNICNKNMLQLHRRQLIEQNIEEIIEDTLMFTKFCIIFHNFIEYNTLSSLFINLCKKNKIPYFIFSEHCERFYFNGEYNTTDKFKKIVKQIIFDKKVMNIEIPEYVMYSQVKSCQKNMKEIINNIRTKYKQINENKESKSIIYVS
jgi:ribosomal protein L7Ae-like RNA K-turn-binding protein